MVGQRPLHVVSSTGMAAVCSHRTVRPARSRSRGATTIHAKAGMCSGRCLCPVQHHGTMAPPFDMLYTPVNMVIILRGASYSVNGEGSMAKVKPVCAS